MPVSEDQGRASAGDGLAVLGQRVHLVTRVALALKVAFVIDTDLAAGVWILTLVDVATGLLVQELVACWARALKANLEVSADVGAAAIVVQTLVQPWGRDTGS